MYKPSLLVFLLLLVYSCSRNNHNFSVEVRVKGTTGNMLYIAQRTISGTIKVDSALPDKSGTYKLAGFTARPDFFIVYNEPRHYINLIIHPGDKFRVLTDATSFDRDYLVEGSKDSRLIQKMVNMQTRTLEKITEMSDQYESSKGRKDFPKIKAKIDSAYDQVVSEHKKFSIELIQNNAGSLASLMALYQQLGRNTAVFDYKKDFHYYAFVDSNLSALYPNLEAVIDLNRKVTGLRDLLKLDIGAKAPEISLPDSSGKITELSSLKGKYVLVLFWASWSSHSVDEFRKYQGLYLPGGSNELEFYQVSLDRSRESWLKIISDKKTKGLNVSDLKYWDSPVVELYNIEKLPVVYLVNKEGTIISKGFTADQFKTYI